MLINSTSNNRGNRIKKLLIPLITFFLVLGVCSYGSAYSVYDLHVGFSDGPTFDGVMDFTGDWIGPFKDGPITGILTVGPLSGVVQTELDGGIGGAEPNDTGGYAALHGAYHYMEGSFYYQHYLYLNFMIGPESVTLYDAPDLSTFLPLGGSNALYCVNTIFSDEFPTGLVSVSTSYMTSYSATPVPIPSGVWLLGSGLIILTGLKRKFRKK